MEQRTQVELLREVLDLHSSRSPYAAGPWATASVDRYVSPEVFALERHKIFDVAPHIVAHASELPQPGAFRTLTLAGRPLLLVRDGEGEVRVFYNVCRHRGAQLVSAPAGCAKRFTCPYHAWTYGTAGDLIGVPHEKAGFPDLDRAAHGLREVQSAEHGGWIWARLGGASPLDVRAYLGELAPEIEALACEAHVLFDSTELALDANWKIIVEGGLEAYHFRVAHRHTIAPLFLDNLSTYRCFGQHIRSVLPRSTVGALTDVPEGEWDLGQHANVLYSLFPSAQFLVQGDHFVWIQSAPVSPSRTHLRISTVVPAAQATAERDSYWRKHHALTLATLKEDFDLGEGIQQGIASGANEHLNFGRYESALTQFNRFVDEMIQV